MRMDKRTVSNVLESSGLNASKRGPAITYPAIDGLRALVDHRNTPDGEISPADQRNLAQAEKLRVEAAVLRREWMPVADAVEIAGKLCDIIQQDVEKWDRDPEERREIVERLQQKLQSFTDELPCGA